MVDALPAHVGDVQQAVDAAEVHERAVVGDVLDHALAHLALVQLGHQLGALLGAGFLENGAARDDDVAARAVHLQDREGLFLAHKRPDVAHGADVDLGARQEGAGAAEVDGEAALHAADDGAHHRLALAEHDLETGPGLLAAGLLAADHRFARGVLHPLQEHFHGLADLGRGLAVALLELLHGDAALGLQTDIHDQEVLLDADHDAVDDGAFVQVAPGEAFVEQRGEVVARGGESHIVSHGDSGRGPRATPPRTAVGWRGRLRLMEKCVRACGRGPTPEKAVADLICVP